MVNFAGWEMPLLYTSILQEHRHVRRLGSVFDISHRGRIELRGRGAEPLLERVCTRHMADLPVGQARYSLVCNEQGGVLDDVVVWRYEDHWLVVTNAGNRDRMLEWLGRHNDGHGAQITDVTEATLMVAVQGPEAVGMLERLLPIPIADIPQHHFRADAYLSLPYAIFRGGYTGEDGVELVLPAAVASLLAAFLESGLQDGQNGLRPAGLGARDTLRLEAGLPLYGHELDEQIDPYSAGLGCCVDLDRDFIGADALRRIARSGTKQQRVGLELDGRRIARQHARVLEGQTVVGQVTSGTFSPMLQRSIAMAYVDSRCATVGHRLTVDLTRGNRTEAVVVALPFYEAGSGKQHPRGARTDQGQGDPSS